MPAPSSLDIYRSAQVLVKAYGQEAPQVAAEKKALMLERGDAEGLVVWRRIMTAIEELLSDGSGAAKH